MTSETIVETKVIATEKIEKTLLQKMPGYQKFKNLANSFIKVFWGFLFIFAAMGLTYSSVKSVKNNSKVVKSLKLIEVTASTSVPDNKLVKIQGTAQGVNPLTLTWNLCDKSNQENISIKDKCVKPNLNTQHLDDLLYYSVKYERYEQHLETDHETKTTIKNGEEYKETVETKKLVENWHTIKTDSKWTNFKIGNILVNPEKAKQLLKTQTKIVQQVYIPNVTQDFYVANYLDKASSQVGDTRLIIEYIPNNTTMLVVGENQDNEISYVKDKPFIVSNMKNEQVISSLETSERNMRLGMRVLAWALYTFGFMMIIGPILALLDFLPIVGKLGRGLSFIISGLLSLILVALGVLIVKYFAFIFIIVLIAGVISIIGMQKVKQMGKSAIKAVTKQAKTKNRNRSKAKK